MEEFTYIFLPLEIKVSFFKPPKCIFSQLISWNRTFEVTLSVNFWSLWQTKYVTMWGWEISTWRTEHSNYLPKSHYGCNLRCIWLYVLLQKYPRVEFFKGPLLQMLKANDFNRDGCRTFIVQLPCWKMKTSLFAWIISEKNPSSETLRWGVLYLFPCSGLDDP